MKDLKSNLRRQRCALALARILAKLAFLCIGLALCGVPGLAQTDSLAERLPADAWLYLHWHGTASLAGVRDTNSVLRLLRDPSVAALPGKLIAYAQSQAKKNKTQTSHDFTQQDADDLVSLLENPAALGFLGSTGATAGTSPNPGSTFFFILDITNKQDLFKKFRARMAAENAALPEPIPIIIDRISVSKTVTGNSTSYEAQAGNFYVNTESLPAMAELLPRLTSAGQTANQIQSIPEIPAACRDFRRNSLLDFVALPGKLNLSQFPSNPNFNASAFIKALHADQLKAACGSLRFETSITHIQGAVLGDTSAGSILNLFGDNQQDFATLALAPSGSAYQCSVIDFSAFYSSLKTAFTAAVPSERAGLVAGMDALLAMSLGMAPADAFQLLTGEFATIRANPAVDPSQMVYALSIRQPDKVVSLIHNLFEKGNPDQKQEGDTTYFTLRVPSGMVPGAPSSPESVTPNSFTVAVSPTMLILSKDQALARGAVSRSRAAANLSSSLSGDAGYQKVRPSLPGKLDSLSYMDLAHFNWVQMARDYQKQLNEQAQQTARITGKPAPPVPDLLSNFDWQAFGRYLHYALGGGWKDPSGIYFDSYIQ